MPLPYKLTRLANGARVITAPMASRTSVTVSLMYSVGSRYEDLPHAGLAHFIEHMLFKGAKRYPTAKEVSAAIEGVGGSLNAATDKEMTMYWAKVPAEHLGLAVDVLSDMVFHASFDPGELVKEQQVVIEELRMYMDNPQDYVHTLFDEVMWPGHPLGRDTAGTEEAVRSFDRSACLSHLSRHYHPERLVVCVSGAFDQEQALSMLVPAIESWGTGPSETTFEAGSAVAPLSDLRLINKRTEQANVVLGGRSVSYMDEERHAGDVLCTILGEGMSSRLFVSLREEQGLAYDVHSFTIRHRDTGAFALYLGCEPKRALKAVGSAVAELRRLAEEPVGEAELRKAREFVRGRLSLSLESTSSVGNFLGQQELLTDEIESPEQILARIELVTAAEVQLSAQRLLTGGLHAAMIGPFRAPEKFLPLLAA